MKKSGYPCFIVFVGKDLKPLMRQIDRHLVRIWHDSTAEPTPHKGDIFRLRYKRKIAGVWVSGYDMLLRIVEREIYAHGPELDGMSDGGIGKWLTLMCQPMAASGGLAGIKNVLSYYRVQRRRWRDNYKFRVATSIRD
ncbi:hypothetical protein KGP36_06370 [Patescibacteria group bacterium]|nr:hypothetical protein [Patescibacteria group bacterium]